MDVPIITFEEIIKLNGHDWDLAYVVLNYHLEKGNIKKEVLESGMVIYHNLTQVQDFTKIHDKTIEANPITNVIMRPRRNRINKDEGDG